MNLRAFLFFFPVLLALSLSACPKKQAEGEAVSNEPVEGSSTASGEKNVEAPADEMQEKKGDSAEGADAPVEDKKE
jgi:hypothetical protein